MVTKAELFIKLAQPDENWVSRRVDKTEFTWEYQDLYFENWCSWGRSDWTLARKYILKRRLWKNANWYREVLAIKLDWFNNDTRSQSIRSDIKEYYKKQRCVVLWTSNPEVDHKDWRKEDVSVMNTQTQRFEDFQPLSKAANDAKRQFCKECIRHWKRYDAKKLGYPVSFTEWNEDYNENIWCKWCFRYDPIEFRKHLKYTWN
jgi:hypothetical protein